ncbi:MAG: type II RES/Xre toxin-antitoxin system antitoxin, partial [Thermoleophilia bacterium]
EEILGGEEVLGRKIKSINDFIELGRQGIKKSAVRHLAASMSLTWRDMAKLLPITERTLQRYQTQKLMNQIVSEQALQLAEVVAIGIDVFADRGNFITWLSMPSAALGGRKPIGLLSSRFGIELVVDELGRIAHGIPA